MTFSPALRTALRAVAIAIALVAAADPSITSSRTVRPDVSVTTSGSVRDSAFSDRVVKALSKDFTVVRAPIAAAAATVIVGERLPAEAGDLASPSFAVFADRDGPVVSLDAVRAPAAAPPNSRVPISVAAHITGARGRAIDVVLRANGLVVDRVTRAIASDDERVLLPLTFAPAVPGATPLRISAMISGARDSATTDIVVDVKQTRFSVLFFDPRPSWMSTFVRRTIERDPRFVLTSRVVTSRNVSTDAGRPPARLDDIIALASFDAIVIGAPDALTEADVTGLEAYLRRRGGGVVFLFDQRAPGAYERLTNAGGWTVSTDSAIVTIGTGGADTIALRASEVIWPVRAPANSHIIARTSRNAKHSASDVPAIWQTSVGAGRLVVSGALDAWRFRDRSGFEGFWRGLIAETAQSSPTAVSVQLSNATPSPGEDVDVRATVRDVALQEPNVARTARATVVGTLTSSERNESTTFHLWPSDAAGEVRGLVRAPEKPGVYQLTVSADGMSTTAPLVVIANASHPTPDDRDLVAAWTASRGGRAIPASKLAELPAELQRAIHPAPRRETWYPMRSAWWIVPFALLLGTEWWVRRRNGLS